MNRKAFTFILLVVFLVSTASAAFNENMDVNDDAQASVDRPLTNHIKAFFNEYMPPLYDLIKWIEGILGG